MGRIEREGEGKEGEGRRGGATAPPKMCLSSPLVGFNESIQHACWLVLSSRRYSLMTVEVHPLIWMKPLTPDAQTLLKRKDFRCAKYFKR
jgi:hypothetical protein